MNVPDANDEAMRDLCRARTDGRAGPAARAARNSKPSCCAMGIATPGKSSWTEAHRRYLRELVLPASPAQSASCSRMPSPRSAAAGERIARLEEQMQALLESWPMKPVVEAMMGLRGFALVGAMVLVSELGGAWRFDPSAATHGLPGISPHVKTPAAKSEGREPSPKPATAMPGGCSSKRRTTTVFSPKVSKELSVAAGRPGR